MVLILDFEEFLVRGHCPPFLFENDFCTFLYFSDLLIMVVVSPTSRHRVRGGTDAEASTSLRNQVGILDIG